MMILPQEITDAGDCDDEHFIKRTRTRSFWIAPISIRIIFECGVFRAQYGNIEGTVRVGYNGPSHLFKVFLFDPLFQITEARWLD